MPTTSVRRRISRLRRSAGLLLQICRQTSLGKAVKASTSARAASRCSAAAGGQIPEEGQPAGAVLGGGDLQAEDLPVPVAVDAGRDQGVHVDHPAALTNLQDEGVGGQKRVRTLVQRAVPEVRDLAVEVLGHLADL